MDKMALIFEGMFGVIFFYYLLSAGFATIMPTATAITIWGLNLTFIVTLTVLGVVLYGGYKLIKSSGWK
jgi:hypothetical protein